jgi:FtsZ-binding cell division protein ZapB
MENQQAQNVLDKLGGKVSQIMQQLQALREENEVLKNDLMNQQAQNEAYRSQIERLESDNAAKEREIEEIVNKIESILG